MSQELLDALSKPFPDEAIQSRQGGGGKSLDYVATNTVIWRLNRVCPAWDFRVTRVEWQNDLCICYGELTIPGLGTRTGIGVQKVSERGGEDLVKGAASDSLKKSATLFGVGLHLYGPDIEGDILAEEAKRNDPRRALLDAFKVECGRLGITPEGVGCQSHIGVLQLVCRFMKRTIGDKLTPEDIAFSTEHVAKWHLQNKAQTIAERPAQNATPAPSPTQDAANFLRPEDEDDAPFEGGVLFPAPEPSQVTTGNYAQNEYLGNPQPTGGKRKVS
jgi:hypothetical protein